MKTYKSHQSRNTKYSRKLFTIDTTTRTILMQTTPTPTVLKYDVIEFTGSNVKLISPNYTIFGTLVSDTA